MRNSLPSQRNQTGDDCGWPDADTVVSQTISASRSLASAAAWPSLSRLSMMAPVLSWSLRSVDVLPKSGYDQRRVQRSLEYSVPHLKNAEVAAMASPRMYESAVHHRIPQ